MDGFVWAWIILGLVLVLAEFLVPGAVLGFIGTASLMVAMLLYFEFISGWLDTFVTFFILTLFLILFVRGFFVRLLPGDDSVDDVDEEHEYIGSIVEVLEEITPFQKGRVIYRDSTWDAQSDCEFSVGDQGVIQGRRGNCWIIKSIN